MEGSSSRHLHGISLWEEGRDGAAKHWYNLYNWPEREHEIIRNQELEVDHGPDGPPIEDEQDQNPPPPAAPLEIPKVKQYEVPEDAYYMVTQWEWEKDVIWDAKDVKCKKQRAAIAGWVPSPSTRTVASLINQSLDNRQDEDIIEDTLKDCVNTITDKTKNGPPESDDKGESFVEVDHLPAVPVQENKTQSPEESYNPVSSILYIENPELVYGRWEDDVIWDAEDIKQDYMKTKVVVYDATDENLVFEMPKETRNRNDGVEFMDYGRSKMKISHPHAKKSRMLLGKAGLVRHDEADEELDVKIQPRPAVSKDFYNISNDEYYQPVVDEQQQQQQQVQKLCHSIPILEFKPPFIRTQFTVDMLRQFHRPSLQINPGEYVILSCEALISKQKDRRDQKLKEILATKPYATEEELCLMRTENDLMGKDGELLLIENCEEHPPFLSQVGMCSKIKNYSKRNLKRKIAPPVTHPYGEPVKVQATTFLGSLQLGQTVSVLENNLYRSPIYPHQNISTDFILIVSRRNIVSIRSYDALFTAGQQCPLYEVPVPNSSKAKSFLRNLVMMVLYSKLDKTQHLNPRPMVPLKEMTQAFPSVPNGTLRKWIGSCCDILRNGLYWQAFLKTGLALPSNEELRGMVTPEQYCAYFSLLAAEQRLKDLGYYGEKCLMFEDENESDRCRLLEDEVKTAPWNTTAAYVGAMKGRWLLQVTGPADPSGCGEGFSYVRVPKKGSVLNEQEHVRPKRIVTGTDADLRRLSVKNAKEILKGCGIPEEEIKKLSRWEIVDLVRTVSSEKEKAGETEFGMTKFSRINRVSVAVNQERYKVECQRVFDLQNKVLASQELLTSDEDGDSDDDDNDEDQAKHLEMMSKSIEKLLVNTNATGATPMYEQEEQERLELVKMIFGEEPGTVEEVHSGRSSKKGSSSSNMACSSSSVFGIGHCRPGSVLKIKRSHLGPKGKLYTLVETIHDPAVIRGYVYLRKNKTKAFLRSIAEKECMQLRAEQRRKRKLEDEEYMAKREEERARLEKATKMPKGQEDEAEHGNRTTTQTFAVATSSQYCNFNNTNKYMTSQRRTKSKRE